MKENECLIRILHWFRILCPVSNKIIASLQLRREYEAEKQKVIQSTMKLKQMEKEVDRVKEEYRTKISENEEKHKHIISDTKKKQWVSRPFQELCFV